MRSTLNLSCGAQHLSRVIGETRHIWCSAKFYGKAATNLKDARVVICLGERPIHAYKDAIPAHGEYFSSRVGVRPIT